MRKKYRIEKINGIYHFSQFIKTEFDREEWDVTSVDEMANESNFICSLLIYNSESAQRCINEYIAEGSNFMVVSIDYEILYKGKPDYDSWIEAVLKYYEERKREQEIENSKFHLRPDFKDYVLKYLEAARVLVSDNSDMEDIIYQRDLYYGEEDEIKNCIEGIKKVL